MRNSKFHNLSFSLDNQNSPVWKWCKASHGKEYFSLAKVVDELEKVTLPLPPKKFLISKNITIYQGNIQLKHYSYANLIKIEAEDPKSIRILENKKRQSVLDILENKEIKAVSTLAYEFLSDEIEGTVPPIKTYNLLVSNGELKQLPILARTALITYEDGTIEPRFINPKGTIEFKKLIIPWQGSFTARESFEGAIAYNCSSGRIEHRSGGCWFGRKRVAALVTTPKNAHRFDITLKKKNGHLYIGEKIQSGGSDVNSSNFVFSLPTSYFDRLEVDEPLLKATLEDLDINCVESAVTVGPLVLPSKPLLSTQINKEYFDRDPALTENPFELGDCTARGVLYKSAGRYVLLIIDALPGSKKYPGVTPLQLLKIISTKERRVDWAVMIDPGQTLKIGARIGAQKKLLFGNMHYCQTSKNKNSLVLNNLRGRIREYYLIFKED